MKVKFFGTRGSMPICDCEFQQFGGNTTCLWLTTDEGPSLIFDGGSGIRNLGKVLAARGVTDQPVVLLFTHFHWDHIQGLPFFAPAYNPACQVTFCAFGRGKMFADLKSIFETQMQRIYFPVPLDRMGAKLSFSQPDSEQFEHNGLQVTARMHTHPGGAYSFRVEYGGKSVVLATDIEHMNGIDQGIVDLARGADLLIHDAQFTPEELETHRGWGHSSWEQAIEVGERAGAKRVALTHHDPDHDDVFLLEVEEKCKQRLPSVIVAREKQEIRV
ncbi:MAG: MBL fold metallo-hydrolase [Gemmataceae bacterium]